MSFLQDSHADPHGERRGKYRTGPDRIFPVWPCSLYRICWLMTPLDGDPGGVLLIWAMRECRFDKVSLCSALPTKKDAHRRHPACFIIRFRFNVKVADKRQWSSAASKPRRKTRAALCSRFAGKRASHQTCRSFSASRYSGLGRRSKLRCRSAAK